MNFINLQVFWWIPVILVFMGLVFWRARVRRTKVMQLVLGPRAGDAEHVQLSLARRFFRFVLLLLTMLMLIAAVARPTWKLQLIPYQTMGRDLMVLFDVSKSMLAQDVRPSRLAHAKLFLRDLVDQSGPDRFGLVAFAGKAFLECPLTTDKTSFAQYIDELDTESIPLGGTNLQLALETAMKAFDAAEGGNRAIILITDGDELTGNSRLALKELKKAKIPLLIVGVGNSNTPALIPAPRGKDNKVKFMRDSKGELVKTRLNVALMQQLAEATGGCFVHSTTANFGLDEIETGIKRLLPAELEKGEKTRPIERFYYFLAFATGLLWLWLVISEYPGKKRKPAVKTAAILLISALLAVSGVANAQKTAPLPVLPAVKAPDDKTAPPPVTDPVAAYNQARQLQLEHKGDPAKLYETAIGLAGKKPAVRLNSFNNLGVDKHHQARQTVSQALALVKQQNLDGALSQLEGAKKILFLAEEMYVKALSTKIPEIPDKGNKLDREQARGQTALNQQLLLNDRQLVDELIKKIKELKKQQQKAQKQTQKAQKQQQQQNKQQQQKPENQRQQDKQQQRQRQQDKQQQQQRQQDKQQQQQQDKQRQQQQQQQQDELKQAQDEVKQLESQAKELKQKKLEKQAGEARKELDKAEQARTRNQGEKAEEHIEKALKQLGAEKQDKKRQNKQQQPDKGRSKEKPEQKPNEPRNKGNKNRDRKLPQPEPRPAQPAKAQEAPKDMNPEEARKLLKLMTEKEKDFRKALKAYQQEQYKNIKVEKDW
ncbi:MAG: VWA domain-containing protein [Victivallaceae bacterium]|nr:VWA domain-containing protein [Victivallaceae bacterium]